MLNALRPAITRITDAPAERLLRAGVSPDAVTLVGTVGVTAGALGLIAQGWFFAGVMVCTLFVLTDMLDGAMARKQQAQDRVISAFGGWLDSTCDRVADAAVFAALVWWATGEGENRLIAALALFCLVAGSIVSYAKARAQGLGLPCEVGFAGRAERLVGILVPVGFVGVGAPEVVLTTMLWVLSVLTAGTVVQRALEVRRQAARHLARPPGS